MSATSCKDQQSLRQNADLELEDHEILMENPIMKKEIIQCLSTMITKISTQAIHAV